MGVVVQANLAGGSGAFIVDPLNHWFGRRGEIFITGVCLTATPIASGFAPDWQSLFIARFFMGIGIGAKNATVPIFSAEIAPARVRGALVMFWQLWVVAGKLCPASELPQWPRLTRSPPPPAKKASSSVSRPTSSSRTRATSRGACSSAPPSSRRSSSPSASTSAPSPPAG